MDNDKGSKFTIVSFIDVPNSEMHKVQCVPHKWTEPSEESNLVRAAYPPNSMELQKVYENADKFPNVSWPFYKALLLYSTGTWKDATDKLSLLRRTIDLVPTPSEPQKRTMSEYPNENAGKKRKLVEPAESTVEVQPIPSTSKPKEATEMDTSNSIIYEIPTLEGFHDLTEMEKTASYSNNVSDDEDEYKANDPSGENVMTKLFDELRNKVMQTINEIQKDFEWNSKTPECDIEFNHDESDRNQPRPTPNPAHLNFTGAGPNIVELMPNSSIYVQAIQLNHTVKNEKNCNGSIEGSFHRGFS